MVKKTLGSSMEDHLEAIYWMIEEKGYARGSEIASFLGHKPSSVTQMLEKLRNLELIKHEKYDIILLTPKGKRIARQVGRKHKTLVTFLILLGVDRKIAEVDACKIEHVASAETMEKITELVKSLQEATDETNTPSDYKGLLRKVNR